MSACNDNSHCRWETRWEVERIFTFGCERKLIAFCIWSSRRAAGVSAGSVPAEAIVSATLSGCSGRTLSLVSTPSISPEAIRVFLSLYYYISAITRPGSVGYLIRLLQPSALLHSTLLFVTQLDQYLRSLKTACEACVSRCKQKKSREQTIKSETLLEVRLRTWFGNAYKEMKMPLPTLVAISCLYLCLVQGEYLVGVG